MHITFSSDPSLSCATLIKADFYNIARPFMAADDFDTGPLMCSICARISSREWLLSRCRFEDCFWHMFFDLRRAYCCVGVGQPSSFVAMGMDVY